MDAAPHPFFNVIDVILATGEHVELLSGFANMQFAASVKPESAQRLGLTVNDHGDLIVLDETDGSYAFAAGT